MLLVNLVKRKFTKALTTIYDPLVKLQIGNQTIKVNLSHQLIEISKIFPEYNFNLARIVKYTEQEIGEINIIDIGANIGDTVAYIRNYSNSPILCIDGDEHYLSLLKINTAQFKNVSIVHSIVGTENKVEKMKLKTGKGTAHIEKSQTSINVRTLENIIEDFPVFKKSKILKTDTDGFDTWIMRSSQNYLQTIKPILFFEFDPHFISKNNDDPFKFIDYLKDIGYYYFIFYTNIGDYLLGCSVDENETINNLIHYFSGREIEMFADICAFVKDDKNIFDKCCKEEIAHFKKSRAY